MRNNDRIILTKERREAMIISIKRYFLKERDEEIGDLASNIMLNFIIKEFASEFYNQGVYDSHVFMNEKNEDLLSIQI